MEEKSSEEEGTLHPFSTSRFPTFRIPNTTRPHGHVFKISHSEVNGRQTSLLCFLVQQSPSPRFPKLFFLRKPVYGGLLRAFACKVSKILPCFPAKSYKIELTIPPSSSFALKSCVRSSNQQVELSLSLLFPCQEKLYLLDFGLSQLLKAQ